LRRGWVHICLNEHVFVSLDDARNKIDNGAASTIANVRNRLGNLTPEEFAAKHRMSSDAARAAWPAAKPELASAAQRAPASDPKPDRFFDRLGS
jgi:hypothetical protein